MTTKPRFNKKEGYRFALLNRSQQDPVLQEGGSEQVLHPLDQRTAEAMETGAFRPEGAINYQTEVSQDVRRQAHANGVSELREVDEDGFALDGYDYKQHLSSAAEGGTFVGANGVEISGRLAFDKQSALPSELFALEEMLPRRVDLEAILLAPELMDDDMRRQLEEEVGDDEAAEEAEWADEFMGQLLGEEEENEEDVARGGKPMTSKLVQGFDFDQHVSRLMRKPKAEMVENDFEGSDEDDLEGEEEEDEEEYEDADAHFAAVLAEYERDNNHGEEDGEQQEEGHLEQSDPIVLRALAIYHQSQEDDTSLGEVGLPPAREDILKFVRPETLLEEEVDITVPLEQPTLEGYMKAWASYQLTERSRFDCETIVSTRSTSDNLPSVITLPSKAPKVAAVPMAAVREEEEEEDGDEEEMLSRMAERMRVADKGEEEEEDELPVKSLLGDSTKRKRDESKEEKKARKSQLRDEKRGRRQEKKEVKFMYKEERKQVVTCLTARNAPMPGVSEFKI